MPIGRLTSLRGVERWAVEAFLTYSLERSDLLPAHGFGVREGHRRPKGLRKVPAPQRMRAIGEACGTRRTVAAWYLWGLPGR